MPCFLLINDQSLVQIRAKYAGVTVFSLLVRGTDARVGECPVTGIGVRCSAIRLLFCFGSLVIVCIAKFHFMRISRTPGTESHGMRVRYNRLPLSGPAKMRNSALCVFRTLLM